MPKNMNQNVIGGRDDIVFFQDIALGNKHDPIPGDVICTLTRNITPRQGMKRDVNII